MNNAQKRSPIRRKFLIGILAITLSMVTACLATSISFMNRMKQEGEQMLADELRRNLSREVEQKVSKTTVMLDIYRGYMKLIRDYAENLYEDRDEMIRSGKFIDSSRASTGEGVYAMQSGFASNNYDLDAYRDEIYFFSHLEAILKPVMKENEKQITTLYMGTQSGLMISYDKWSTLSAVPEPDFFVYDYTKSDWFRQGLEAEDVFFTDLYVDAVGRGLTVTIATPFKDPSGVVQGVMAADFDITGIYSEMISMELGSGSTSFAIDKDGKIISLDTKEVVQARDYIAVSPSELERMTSGETGMIETAGAFYSYAHVDGVEWTLCAMVPRTVLLERVSTLENSYRVAMLLILMISMLLVIVGVYLSNRLAIQITHPIELMENDMKIIADGNLEHRAVAHGNDEIGDMTVRLNEMVERLKETLQGKASAEERAEQMHELAYRDALTSVKNKGAYADYIQQLQDAMDRGEKMEFAIGVFDCDNLKQINDQYGHDKGDEYLVTASRLICHVFKHSPVFRIGGDEYAVGLQNEDYHNRDALIEQFRKEQRDQCEKAENPWEEVRVSLGVAVYDPYYDSSVIDTSRRADKIMYENKGIEKERHKGISF